ncbi:MAG TPA: primase C-terminal domain-containing protein [Aggregatilinea sp.]|uniref:primase C-terminal domain-containing protein n=1 Tax=Aggregatilinea sp. TaxID=2806333 RepID=UPI002C15643A|nr:primase C-terminal domain-containing protein [Aggregatilinea sp.]HML23756.1 primase C-terminal domain-containing protein [Aggregatilinea sp.]
MSDNASAIKPEPQSPALSRDDFFAALYSGANPGLLLELRCIHPETEQTRVLWAPIGNQQRLAATLRQADTLNTSGYGVFFAPCLRSEKKGSAEAAALVPALWVDIDCDDDPAKRSSALETLHTFDPKPSIIIDSGGGWHAYWLLEEPFVLRDDAAREQITNTLHGLFAAVGGDAEYAKSVASLMRLPGSVNTKPERGGVVAVLTEFHPDQRYPCAAFEWLAVKQGGANGKSGLVLLGNGHAPLPQVTLDYLASGASNGNRNRTLFDAACQFRDAGYTQNEAEAQLVLRHVADGAGNEQPATREREARATITSAYQQAARDPIVEPTSDARQMVDRLVSTFGAQDQPNQPKPEQIAAAVQACAHLEAVEWAVQRQKLKGVCGNGVRLTDLDRQYRQARKALERERVQDYDESEEYYADEERMVYRRDTYHGPVEKTVAAWVGRVKERISQVNDDGQVEHVTALELRNDHQTLTLNVPSEMFGDDAALRRFIAGQAGEAFTVRAGMGKHLAPAILSLSGEYPCRTCYRFMGWTQIDGRWTYVAPGVCINAEGALVDPPEIELDARLRDYSLQQASWEDSLLAFAAIIPVFPKTLAPACIAFALLPLLQRFFPAAAPRPAIHLAGTYGSGKSELAALMSSFYGAFSRDTPPAQWGDTINTVEAMGYPLANALYWVDDYKSIYADERTFTRFLQSYSRGMGRGRLTREARLRQDRPCRGTLLSTGETMLEGEASVLSRMLVLDVPPWEHRDPGGNALEQADLMRHALPGFTVKFAAWIAQQVEQGDLANQLANEFAISVQGYRDKLKASGLSMANTGRVIQNWAVLVTIYRLLREFLMAQDADDVLPSWQDVIVETAQTVRQERASEVFLNNLSQLLASGDVMLAKDTRNPEEPRPGTTLIGYRDAHFIYLLPEVAYREVNRVQPLRFTVAAIGSQLREDGSLVTLSGDRHLAIQIRIRGDRVRVWRLRSEILSGDSGDCGDSAPNDARNA